MRVKVYAPAFVDQAALDADHWVTLREGASLQDLYQRLKLPLRLSFLCSVNYEAARWNQKLNDGDTVSFLLPFSGG